MLIKYLVLKKNPNLTQWRAEKGLSAIKVIFKCMLLQNDRFLFLLINIFINFKDNNFPGRSLESYTPSCSYVYGYHFPQWSHKLGSSLNMETFLTFDY